MSVHSIPNHPRIHSDKQLRQIAASVDKFGFVVPVIIDDEHRIVRERKK